MTKYRIARLMDNGNYASMPGKFATFIDAKTTAGEWKRQRPAVNYVVTENGNACCDVTDTPAPTMFSFSCPVHGAFTNTCNTPAYCPTCEHVCQPLGEW